MYVLPSHCLLLADVKDWCEAHADGQDVPEVRLVWSCRRVAEMALVGESLPSLLASAGAGAEDRFEMSLFCSGKVGPIFFTGVYSDGVI